MPRLNPQLQRTLLTLASGALVAALVAHGVPADTASTVVTVALAWVSGKLFGWANLSKPGDK